MTLVEPLQVYHLGLASVFSFLAAWVATDARKQGLSITPWLVMLLAPVAVFVGLLFYGGDGNGLGRLTWLVGWPLFVMVGYLLAREIRIAGRA